jgi:hypothetical protein
MPTSAHCPKLPKAGAIGQGQFAWRFELRPLSFLTVGIVVRDRYVQFAVAREVGDGCPDW